MRTAGGTYPGGEPFQSLQTRDAPPTMTLEAHATAAGAGHPLAGQPPGTLVTLAETIVIKEENVFAVSHRDGSLPVGTEHPLGFYLDDCRFLSRPRAACQRRAAAPARRLGGARLGVGP